MKVLNWRSLRKLKKLCFRKLEKLFVWQTQKSSKSFLNSILEVQNVSFRFLKSFFFILQLFRMKSFWSKKAQPALFAFHYFMTFRITYWNIQLWLKLPTKVIRKIHPKSWLKILQRNVSFDLFKAKVSDVICALSQKFCFHDTKDCWKWKQVGVIKINC